MPRYFRFLRYLKPLIPRRLHPFLKKQLVDLSIGIAALQDKIMPSTEEAPFPPPRLRHRVHGAVERESFASVGRTISRDLIRLADSADQSPTRFTNVLDFGCGCGRVLRYIHRELPDAQLYGADIDPESIEWCRRNFLFGEFALNHMKPPMDFPDGHFDWIFGVSVFTHLDEDLQNIWLQELHRVSRTGAQLILTVHGSSIFEPALDLEKLERLQKDGIYFHVVHTGKFKPDGLPDYYQTTFHTREYIEKHWRKYFEIVDYVPQGVCDYQDAAILRKA